MRRLFQQLRIIIYVPENKVALAANESAQRAGLVIVIKAETTLTCFRLAADLTFPVTLRPEDCELFNSQAKAPPKVRLM